MRVPRIPKARRMHRPLWRRNLANLQRCPILLGTSASSDRLGGIHHAYNLRLVLRHRRQLGSMIEVGPVVG